MYTAIALVVFALGVTGTAFSLRVPFRHRPLKELVAPLLMIVLAGGIVKAAEPRDLSLILLFSFIPGIYLSYLFIGGRPEDDDAKAQRDAKK